MRIARSDSLPGILSPVSSGDYWRRIFTNNPAFSSWHEAKQSQVKSEVVDRLRRGRTPLRVLDYGIGNLGLYRCFDETLLASLRLTGISESQQHDPDDELIERYRVQMVVGNGSRPLRRIPSESQDFVISTYVFAYLEECLRVELLREFARVLAPNGELILVLHHADGRRNKNFKQSDSYWTRARRLYIQLLTGRYESARRTLAGLSGYLDEFFSDDIKHRNYLESYIRTGARFLEMSHLNGDANVEIPDEALSDCEDMIRLINREHAMTCRAFRPIEHPESEILLPGGLRFARLAECLDPADQTPIANFFCASKSPTRHVGRRGTADLDRSSLRCAPRQ